MPIQMGIGRLGNPDIGFKRKFRWTFSVIGAGGSVIPPDFVKVAARPNVTIEETELNFLHGKMFIPGKATFETITVTWIDVTPTRTDTTLNVYNWIASVYNFFTPNSRNNPTMNTRTIDYTATGVLTLYDGCGDWLENWYLIQCWPQSVNFGDLDYTNNEESTIEVTLRYQFARWEANPVCGAKVTPYCNRQCDGVSIGALA